MGWKRRIVADSIPAGKPSDTDATLIDRLRQQVPDLGLKTEPDTLASHGRDWVSRYRPAPAAVAFPTSTDQVQQLVRFANDNQCSLVPSGGRSGLSGGASASHGEIVVSFDRMNAIGAFNAAERTVEVEAGVITQTLQEFAASKELFYPVDFAAKGSSQIGGNIATNAGGVKVIRHGLTREWVAGLTVVTGAGEVLQLNKGLIKNACGYDFRHLFIGSEGTLGLIVSAIIKLAPPPLPQQVMLLACPDMTSVVELLGAAQRRLTVSAYEFFSELALQKVQQRHGGQRPLETASPFYALIEFDCPADEQMDAALALFEEAAEAGWVEDGVISQSEAQADQLWGWRENISEAISHQHPYKNDIAVRSTQTGPFLAELDALVVARYPDFEVVWFGHIGDGNLHLNILKPETLSHDDFAAACEEVNDLVFELVERYDGSISAEHGVGRLKRPYLHYSRSAAEISLMRGIKQVFDPNGVMNPGKLL